MEQGLICLLLGIAFSVIIAPIVIKLSRQFKFSQTILHYVEEHKSKQGTPTMGGMIFILPIIFIPILFLTKDYVMSIVSIVVTLSYGVLGFLDDFIKIRFKQNQGLRAYQKVIGQVGISAIIAVFCYRFSLIGTTIVLPFTKAELNIGLGIIPLVIIVYLATTNSVNLTDGMDGLASGVSIVFLAGFTIILSLISNSFDGAILREYQNLLLLSYASIGALIGFVCFNCYPAKIFMGDTGSLALGGLMASLCVFSRLELYIPILGIMFVLSALSDIIQVLHYKRTKKRIFLMAPLHHHFQMKGVNENRIVAIYIVITLVVSIATIMLVQGVYGVS